MGYRPIADMWLLARAKVGYYGAYPSGFLSRARELLGVGPDNPVLHVCSGKVRDYPYRGFGDFDETLDLDVSLMPDWRVDVVSEDIPLRTKSGEHFAAILADPPYTDADAKHYMDGKQPFPSAGNLLKKCLDALEPGRRVGMLHYVFPRPPKNARLVACVGVLTGYSNRIRCFSVFENDEDE